MGVLRRTLRRLILVFLFLLESRAHATTLRTFDYLAARSFIFSLVLLARSFGYFLGAHTFSFLIALIIVIYVQFFTIYLSPLLSLLFFLLRFEIFKERSVRSY